MRFPPPWQPDPDTWKDSVPQATRPGLEEGCRRLAPGVPPVVHRFHDLILLPHGPFELPETPPASHARLYSYLDQRSSSAAPPPPPTLVSSGRPVTQFPWQVRQLRWGLFLEYEQAWTWEGASLGELIESISLAPLEELDVQVFTWDRTKITKDFESTELVDQSSETSLTTHDSAQVVHRMENEKHWEFGANVGFSSGVTAGLDLSVGETTRDVSERRREQIQDATSRTARQVRSERKTRISTVHETGIEERRTRKIRNRNAMRSVTYNFYETLSHYRVENALVEATWVVAIPNPLPVVTPEWVACHEGILRAHLRDETQLPGFAAARWLSNRYPPDRLGEAARRLLAAFAAQPRVYTYPAEPGAASRPQPVRVRGRDEPVDRAERMSRIVAAIFTLGLSELVRAAVEEAGAEATVERQSFYFITSFLEGVAAQPSVPGLLAALKLVVDWYTPWVDGADQVYYPMSVDAEQAIGFAYSVLVDATGEYPQTLETPTDGEGEEADQARQAAREAWLAWKREQQEKVETLVENEALFSALRCHLEENLLHYLRPIWLQEDPGVRMARIGRQLLALPGAGPLIAQLVEQPLLAFHLNCSVFAVRLGDDLERAMIERLSSAEWHDARLPDAVGPRQLVERLSPHARGLRKRVLGHFGQLARDRFERQSLQLLHRAIEQAVTKSQICGPAAPLQAAAAPIPLRAEQLPQVLEDAGRQVMAAIEAARDNPDLLLGDDERTIRQQADRFLETLERVEVDEGRTRENLHEVWVAGRVAADARARRDLKPIVVTLPDGGYHCEPVVGTCDAVDPLRARQLEAFTRKHEAVADQERAEATRRQRRVDAGEISAEPTVRAAVTVEQPPRDR